MVSNDAGAGATAITTATPKAPANEPAGAQAPKTPVAPSRRPNHQGARCCRCGMAFAAVSGWCRYCLHHICLGCHTAHRTSPRPRRFVNLGTKG